MSKSNLEQDARKDKTMMSCKILFINQF